MSPPPGSPGQDKPGYAEPQPRDKRDAHAPHRDPPAPSPDEPGIDRDTDETPDPARTEKNR
jgi:hypothetical protein